MFQSQLVCRPANITQISVITDATAIEEHFVNTLAQAKGSSIHAALNTAKGAVSGVSRMVASSDKSET